MVFGDGFHQSHRQIIAGNWRIRLAEIEASLKTNQGNTGKSQVAGHKVQPAFHSSDLLRHLFLQSIFEPLLS